MASIKTVTAEVHRLSESSGEDEVEDEVAQHGDGNKQVGKKRQVKKGNQEETSNNDIVTMLLKQNETLMQIIKKG